MFCLILHTKTIILCPQQPSVAGLDSSETRIYAYTLYIVHIYYHFISDPYVLLNTSTIFVVKKQKVSTDIHQFLYFGILLIYLVSKKYCILLR